MKTLWVEEQNKSLVRQGTEYEPRVQGTIQQLQPREEVQLMERKEALTWPRPGALTHLETEGRGEEGHLRDYNVSMGN